MKRQPSRRGRPKGSGIDDSRLLREIAETIQEDPELRPTTAIKKMGISDPSSIRRLRDKFNSNKEAIFRELESDEPSEKQRFEKHQSHLGSNNRDPRHESVEVRTIALNHRREPARSEPMTAPSKSKFDHDTNGDSDDESRRSGPSFLMPEISVRRVMADNLRATSAMWQFQFAVACQAFQSPFVRSTLFYQLAYSQTLLGFAKQ